MAGHSNIELREMRRRADAARRAVELVLIHAADGLYGELPAEETPPRLTSAVASARDVPRLLEVVERLLPATYLHGPEECADGDCDEQVDDDGNRLLGYDQRCSHVEERVATLGDVKRADHLDSLAKALRRAAEAAERGGGIDDRDMARIVIEAVDEAYERMAADDEITDVVPPAGLVSAESAGSPRDRSKE